MNRTNNIALHVCCAPCLAGGLASLRGETGSGPGAIGGRRDNGGIGIGGVFFYNPNIHPLLEFRRRLKALRVYLERDPLPAEIVGEYGLETFLAKILEGGRLPAGRRDRCRRCYLLRLSWVAERAKAAGFGAFSTTLLASREQDVDLVADAGQEVAGRFSIDFVRCDFRSGTAPEKLMRGIYRQQYCGCIFSEEERYRNTTKHLYRGDGGDGEDNR